MASAFNEMLGLGAANLKEVRHAQVSLSPQRESNRPACFECLALGIFFGAEAPQDVLRK